LVVAYYLLTDLMYVIGDRTPFERVDSRTTAKSAHADQNLELFGCRYPVE
jgi:hypothetical protein